VKIQQNRNHPRQQWLKRPMLSCAYRNWLIDNGSLTARLKARYTDFVVRPVSLKNAKSFVDESTRLGLKASQYTLIREVLLMGGNQPVVFAHSVLPRTSLRGAWNRLGRLGNKPLGAALFANPKVKRTPLEYKKLSACSPMFMRLSGHVLLKKQQLWMRRSVFSLGCAKIMVTEVFLPHILAP
jgi:chorismate lyase